MHVYVGPDKHVGAYVHVGDTLHVGENEHVRAGRWLRGNGSKNAVSQRDSVGHRGGEWSLWLG